MHTVNIHEAKTNLSRLVAQAVRGESFIIAKAGKPMVKVTAIHAADVPVRRRTGFLAGLGKVPDAETFNTMGREEIEAMFYGEE